MFVVGGVSQLYQGDLDLGRRAVERLRCEDLGPDVVLEDLHYGAVAVAQRLEELRPDALVLVGAEERGRPPGSVQRRRVDAATLSPGALHAAVSDAVQGYVSIGLVIDVAGGLGVLPSRTIAIEVEPSSTDPATELSPAASAALDQALGLVREELRRAPLLRLADELRALVAEDRIERTAALDALRDVLDDLAALDREGRWGRTFADRDRLRQAIAAGVSGEGMTHLDWGLWWALIEELDRLQQSEAAVSGG